MNFWNTVFVCIFWLIPGENHKWAVGMFATEKYLKQMKKEREEFLYKIEEIEKRRHNG